MFVDAAGSTAHVTGAIRQAARLTGASFDYLLATAQVESRLDAGARAKSSSAQGLFQFIEQTWLATLKQAGPAFGYGRYAAAISRTPSGGYVVGDAGLRREILALRKDPAANAIMAGIFTRQNAARLGSRLGRPVSEGELYIAHFLGANGATRLIGAAGERPSSRAADLFPTAARANRSIFYTGQGRARSVAEVYETLVGRYQVARTEPGSRTAAAVGPVRPAPVEPVRADTAHAYAASQDTLVDDGPVFHSLFRTGARREAVAPVVNELWTGPAGDRDAPVRNPVASAFEALGAARPGVRRLFTGG